MGNTIPYFPPVAPYPTGVTSASRRGLALREWNKTCTLALKTTQKCTNDVDKTTFPTQINAKYVIWSIIQQCLRVLCMYFAVCCSGTILYAQRLFRATREGNTCWPPMC